jgi:long-chain acyl-CoA synthetase
MLSHNNVGFSSMAVITSGVYRHDTVFLHVMPMFHLADYAGMTALTISGGRHVVLPGFSPQLTLETIAAQKVNEILLAPTMIQMLLDARDACPTLSALDLTSLRSIAYGASPMTPALLDRARAAFPSASFTQGYGMTELSPMATTLDAEYHCTEHQLSGKMYSVGKPQICVELRIVDPQDNEVPRGIVGEIIVRGPNVMLGYWKNPEATAETLRNGWMHTGDGGYMDEDGFVHLCDRIKDMIVSGGENVYSAEVETAIARHPAIAQSAVIGVPCERWGERVHAVIVLKPSMQVSEEELVAHCREHIAGYKVPRSMEFRDALPLSSVGKVLKTELRKPFWEGRERNIA